MLTEIITAMMVEHDRQLELRNKTIRDRETELALVVKELQDTREELFRLERHNQIKNVPFDVAVPVKGLNSKAQAKRGR